MEMSAPPPTPPQTAFPFSSFNQQFFGKPKRIMLWGDVGVGKSTIALQLARSVLQQQQKVFFLYTKRPEMKDLINRILHGLSPKQTDHFLFWHAATFSEQTQIIFDWILQIQQLKQYFGKNRVGLIVIDEISSLYLVEMGSEKKNEENNQRLHLQQAILSDFVEKYGIPVLMLNNFTTKKGDQDQIIETPYGGKITNYWTDLEIRISRTPQSGRRELNLMKSSPGVQIPSTWFWLLEQQGFI
jgi:RecA/RadA recombinase